MKSAVFYKKHDIKIENLEIPEIKEDEVLVHVMACGICGTDIHIFEGDEGAAATPSGTVLGHEFSGIIEKVGVKVSAFNVGDRVCVDPNKLCGICPYCKSGIGHFCESMIGIGTTVNGGLSEYCAVPQSQLYKLNENISYTAAAMTEPVACCLHGIDMCDISAGDNVAVIGGGMIGLIMLQLAKLKGAANIILLEPVESKRAMAKKLGADLCIDPLSEDAEKIISDTGMRISTVIECVGKTGTMQQAISLAGKKSTVMLFGLSRPQDEINIKPFELFKKEITLKSSFINPYTMERAINLISSGKIDVESMIYAEESLEKLPEILSDCKLRSQGKFVIKP